GLEIDAGADGRSIGEVRLRQIELIVAEDAGIVEIARRTCHRVRELAEVEIGNEADSAIGDPRDMQIELGEVIGLAIDVEGPQLIDTSARRGRIEATLAAIARVRMIQVVVIGNVGAAVDLDAEGSG